MEKSLISIIVFLFAVLLTAQGADFSLEQPSAEWLSVLEELQSAEAVRSKFEEERSNPFHRVPRRFEGVIRWKSDDGLSIQYEKPGPLTVVVSGDEMFITKSGETKKLSSELEQGDFLTLFSRLFDWDIPWLSENFSSEGRMDSDGAWKLELIPKEKAQLDFLRKLVLEGESSLLNGINLDLRGGRTIEILLFDQQTEPIFTEDELQQAYPHLHE